MTIDMDGVGMKRARVGIGAAGVVIGLVGVYAFVTAVPSRQWLGIFTWLGGTVVAHDVLLAPAAVVLGLSVFAFAPRRLRAPARVLALALASVALIGVPLLMTR